MWLARFTSWKEHTFRWFNINVKIHNSSIHHSVNIVIIFLIMMITHIVIFIIISVIIIIIIIIIIIRLSLSYQHQHDYNHCSIITTSLSLSTTPHYHILLLLIIFVVVVIMIIMIIIHAIVAMTGCCKSQSTSWNCASIVVKFYNHSRDTAQYARVDDGDLTRTHSD